MHLVPVCAFDDATGEWTEVDARGAIERDALTLTTYNIWFDSYFAQLRHQAIADLLFQDMPDVMVFQEVTPAALSLFLAQPWIRQHYRRLAVIGGHAGDYGMLMLSRLPINRATYTRLPIRSPRGILRAEMTINGRPLTVCSVHLASGKASTRLRRWQLRRLYWALRRATDAVVLGDFNMRDHENTQIPGRYRDAWPALRPHQDGFTEDTSINLMRFDSKNKHRRVRFDRVLVKGDAWSPADIELLGTAPVASALPRVFPSDHFGVRCRLVRHDTRPISVNS